MHLVSLFQSTVAESISKHLDEVNADPGELLNRFHQLQVSKIQTCGGEKKSKNE